MKFEHINGTLCRMVEPELKDGKIVIGYPVKDGSVYWAAYQMMQGKMVCQDDSYFKRYLDNEYVCWTCRNGRKSSLSMNIFLKNFADTDGWQIHEPEPKESPVDPKERPLRNLILRAKEQGMNIRTWYQDLIFTPESLTSYLSKGRFRWWNIGDWELTKRDANMPTPEPEPEFKVGDWVEMDYKGTLYHCQVISVHDNGIRVEFVGATPLLSFDGKNNMVSMRLIRKLDPSEVRIKITLEGQVTKPMDNDVSRFWLYYSTDEYVSVELDALRPKDRELVESLLKAQEEK